jgi:hypothetical protein
MTTPITNTHMLTSKFETTQSDWKGLYRLGGVAALLIVLTAVIEILLTFLPGGYAAADTVVDWFTLLHAHPFLGLRNLGLLNIVMNLLGIPLFFALYIAHRNNHAAGATLALILSLLGVAIFYATNRAFAMLDLGNQYAAATSEAQRSLLAAAGQALLSVGESHTPGTFLGFFFAELAGMLMSLVMLRGRIFNPSNGYCGLLGFGLLFIFEIGSSFVPSVSGVVLIFAVSGGLLNLAWYLLLARRLFQLGQSGKG